MTLLRIASSTSNITVLLKETNSNSDNTLFCHFSPCFQEATKSRSIHQKSHSTLDHYQTMQRRSNQSCLSNHVNQKAPSQTDSAEVLQSLSISVNHGTGFKTQCGLVRSNRRIITHLNERQRLLIFIKVLFKYLKQVEDNSVLTRAKIAMSRRIRENELGVAAVEHELRQCVGSLHWQRASFCCYTYCSKVGLRFTNPTNYQVS
mmetsp:Transcript_5485/g.10651  ORF Transcript_5485/g.10651 Transcript_5485/m.10651 type:complete len:204 (+) Transcript_5485:290-901(+)